MSRSPKQDYASPTNQYVKYMDLKPEAWLCSLRHQIINSFILSPPKEKTDVPKGTKRFG